MSEDEKLRFILIVSAIVAALAVYRFLDTSQAVARPSTGLRFFAPSGAMLTRDTCGGHTSRAVAMLFRLPSRSRAPQRAVSRQV